MRERFEFERQRSQRLDRLVRALEAENLVDAERSAELREALAPFTQVPVAAQVVEDLDARFASADVAPSVTVGARPRTAPFFRA